MEVKKVYEDDKKTILVSGGTGYLIDKKKTSYSLSDMPLKENRAMRRKRKRNK